MRYFLTFKYVIVFLMFLFFVLYMYAAVCKEQHHTVLKQKGKTLHLFKYQFNSFFYNVKDTF